MPPLPKTRGTPGRLGAASRSRQSQQSRTARSRARGLVSGPPAGRRPAVGPASQARYMRMREMQVRLVSSASGTSSSAARQASGNSPYSSGTGAGRAPRRWAVRWRVRVPGSHSWSVLPGTGYSQRCARDRPHPVGMVFQMATCRQITNAGDDVRGLHSRGPLPGRVCTPPPAPPRPRQAPHHSPARAPRTKARRIGMHENPAGPGDRITPVKATFITAPRCAAPPVLPVSRRHG